MTAEEEIAAVVAWLENNPAHQDKELATTDFEDGLKTGIRAALVAVSQGIQAGHYHKGEGG